LWVDATLADTPGSARRRRWRAWSLTSQLLSHLYGKTQWHAADAVAPNSAVSASGASSREANSASGTLEVSLPPLRLSAPPRFSALRITVAFSSFACLHPTKDSWRGQHMANRRSINSYILAKWVHCVSPKPRLRHSGAPTAPGAARCCTGEILVVQQNAMRVGRPNDRV